MGIIRPTITIGRTVPGDRAITIGRVPKGKKPIKRFRKKLDTSIDGQAFREGKAIVNSYKIKKPMGKKVTLDRRGQSRADAILDSRAAKRHLVDTTPDQQVWGKCRFCNSEFTQPILKIIGSKRFDKDGDRYVQCDCCGTKYWHYNEGKELIEIKHIIKGKFVWAKPKGWHSDCGQLVLMSKISNW